MTEAGGGGGGGGGILSAPNNLFLLICEKISLNIGALVEIYS